MATEISIANLALARLGVTRSISSFEEVTNKESILCKQFYAQSRDFVLSDHPWPYLIRYRDLALIEENPNADWAYSYRYPNQCLRIIRLVDGNKSDTSRIPYEFGNDDSGTLIFTDQPAAVIRYVHLYTDTTYYPADLVSCIAWRMMADMVGPLARDPKLMSYGLKMYEIEKSISTARMQNELQHEPEADPEHIRVR